MLLTRNSVLLSSFALDAEQFLLHFPRGPFTTARTVQRTRIFEFDLHVSRLTESAALMISDGKMPQNEFVSSLAKNPDSMKSLLKQHWGSSLKQYFAAYPGDDEIRLTSLLNWSEKTQDNVDVYVHLAPMPGRRHPPVIVRTHTQARVQPKAKDSSWVAERKPFKVNGEEEIILQREEDGALLEGASSNLFAVVNGQLMTPNEDILFGTMRALVLELCEKENISVRLTPITLDQVPNIKEAFLTSTSRLVLPIDIMHIGEESIHFDSKAIGSRLLAAVKKELFETSTEICD